MSGNVTVISLTEIKKWLLLTEARLECSEYTSEKSPDLLVKMLTELTKYDLALNLALDF